MHNKSLIACRMQMEIKRGEAWEIWSCVVTTGRQMVDTRGAVPDNHVNSSMVFVTINDIDAAL